MLLSFTLFFALFIATFSFTQSLTAGLYLLLFVLLLLTIKSLILRKADIQNIKILFIGFFIAFASIQLNYYTYNQTAIIPSQSEVKINNKGYGYIISTGTILEQQTDRRYLRASQSGTKYFLYSDKSHSAGDIVFLSANANILQLKSLFTDNKNKNSQIRDNIKNFSFDYDSRQQSKMVAGTLFENNSIKLDNQSLGLISDIRSKIKDQVMSTFDNTNTRGIIGAITISDRSLLDKDLYQNFADSGIVHIIAISGGHVVILVIFLNLLLFFLPFYVRILVIIPIIIFYALLCGLQASVLRSTIMGVLSLLALFVGRQTLVWRSLWISFVFMLIINPLFLIYDIGFLFSFSAVVGIVYFSKLSSELNLGQSKISKTITFFIKKYLIPSLGATIAITPFLLLFIGQFNIFSIIANVFVVPLVPIIMIGGWVLLIFNSFIPDVCITLLDAIILYISFIATITSDYGIYIQSKNQIYSIFIIFIFIILFILERHFKFIDNIDDE